MIRLGGISRALQREIIGARRPGPNGPVICTLAVHTEQGLKVPLEVVSPVEGDGHDCSNSRIGFRLHARDALPVLVAGWKRERLRVCSQDSASSDPWLAASGAASQEQRIQDSEYRMRVTNLLKAS